MKRTTYARLVCGALYELVRYEVILALRGGSPKGLVGSQSIARKSSGPELERAICDAVLLATCLYWKPVLCQQRSVCVVRLLRKHGIRGRLVIGYRRAPFFAHAWAEVEGRVVNGSSAYRERLQPLYSI